MYSIYFTFKGIFVTEVDRSPHRHGHPQVDHLGRGVTQGQIRDEFVLNWEEHRQVNKGLRLTFNIRHPYATLNRIQPGGLVIFAFDMRRRFQGITFLRTLRNLTSLFTSGKILK